MEHNVTKLFEQINLLECLCETFDNKVDDLLALPISTSIRVLVHQTQKSTSLLKMNGMENIKFISTSTSNPRNGLDCRLVRLISCGVNDGVGGESKYYSLQDERYFPANHSKEYITLEEWWTKENIFVYKTERIEKSLTRKVLVLQMCNKDGGTHYDAEVDGKYRYFKEDNFNNKLVGLKSGIIKEHDNLPIHCAVRQIAYELIETIKMSDLYKQNINCKQ